MRKIPMANASYLVIMILLLEVFHINHAFAGGSAGFRRPTQGAVIEREFGGRGYRYEYEILFLKVDPKEIYYLAHEIDGLMWPKKRLTPVQNGEVQTGSAVEGGSLPNGRFRIILIAVSEDENREIVRWFNEGSRSGSFPGIMLSNGPIASVDVMIKK